MLVKHNIPRSLSIRGRSSTVVVRSSTPESGPGSSPTESSPASSSVDILEKAGKKKRTAESTDWMATQMTRRFGIAGGLAWFGVLAVGSLGEQVKTRIEVANEEKNAKEVQNAKEVTLKSGVKYTDLKIGGGSYPDRGLLAVIHYKGTVVETGDVFEDTIARGKPIVVLFGSRPFTAGMTAGLEEALKSMKAGGKRTVIVPPALGFGEAGGVINSTRHAGDKNGTIPPNATLKYEVELLRVSIPPS